MGDLQETYEALNTILTDKDTFGKVVEQVFESIDSDGSGTIEVGEIEGFIGQVCGEMGIKDKPNSAQIKAVFDELDEDKSKSISKDELGKFLRSLFEEQRKLCAEQLGKN